MSRGHDVEIERIECGQSPPLPLLEECSLLFSSHYGRWSADHPDANRRGHRIKQGPTAIRSNLVGDHASVITARAPDNTLVGYAIACRLVRGTKKKIRWVTQLVVHADYRNQGVASRLLYAAWGEPHDFGVGRSFCEPVCNPRT